jgi:beta-galactosidase
MNKTTFPAPTLRRWLALAAATVLLSACGSDNAKPSAPQAAVIAAEAAQKPPVITDQPQSTAVVSGGSAKFTVTATGEALSYQWLSNDQPLPKAVGPTYTTSAAAATDSGTRYSVRVSNGNGEVISQAAVLTVSEAMFSN